MRENPLSLVPIIEEELNFIDAEGLVRRPGKNPYTTTEKGKAHKEAIRFLRELAKVPKKLG